MYTPLPFMQRVYPRKRDLLFYTRLFPYGIIIGFFHWAIIMIRRSCGIAMLLVFSLAGCGGPSDAPVQQTGIAASMASSRAAVQLGTPVTNASARAAQGFAPGVDYQRRESALVVDGTAFRVDTSDREAVRLFYNRIHREPTPPIGWTGNHAAGAPGTTTPAFRAGVMQRVNW